MAASSSRPHKSAAQSLPSTYQFSFWPEAAGNAPVSLDGTGPVRPAVNDGSLPASGAGTFPVAPGNVMASASGPARSGDTVTGSWLQEPRHAGAARCRDSASGILPHGRTDTGSRSRGDAQPPRPPAPVTLQYGSVPQEWTGNEPPLMLDVPWLRKQAIPMSLLSRHVMATGESGSGKTRSCIVPLLGPLLRYVLPADDGIGKLVSMLLVDPKGELGGRPIPALVDAERAGRLVRICSPGGRRTARVRFFEGLEHLSISDRLAKIEQIAPASWKSDSGNGIWIDQARGLLHSFANAEASCRSHTGGSLLARALRESGAPTGMARPSFFQQLQTLLNHVCQDAKRLHGLNALLVKVGVGLRPGSADFGFLSTYVATDDLIEQFNYVNMSLMPLLTSLNGPEVTSLVDFDPFSRPGDPDHFSIYDMVEQGNVILFSPSSLAQESITLVGRVLKTLFFQAVFTRRDRERPVAYVCDEFHRFVTSDTESGEQNLLDRCRAYRCICILATQSVESIRYALTGQTSPDAAIGVMLNNIACKLFMRNSDPRTAELLRSLLPLPPDGGLHITQVRPLTTLRPGEAYFLHADGSWGRKQVVLA